MEFDLRSLSDEEFILFEKKFNAEKAFRGSSYVHKGYGSNYGRIVSFVEKTFPKAPEGIKMNIRRELDKAIMLLSDYKTLNFEGGYNKDDPFIMRPKRRTQLKRTEAKEYARVYDSFLDVLVGNGIEISEE